MIHLKTHLVYSTIPFTGLLYENETQFYTTESAFYKITLKSILQIWIWILHWWKSISQWRNSILLIATDEIYETEIKLHIFEFQFYSHANGFYMIENEIHQYSDKFYIDNLNLTKLWKRFFFYSMIYSMIPPSLSPKSGQKMKMYEKFWKR